MILQTLYQQCLKHGVKFYDEYHVVDLVTEGGDLGSGGRAAGVVAYRIADGELETLRSKAVMLATGGFGRMFRVTSNAWSLTGDGVALAYRHGIPMQDMEFYQFHPTGIVGIGILLSEAARGEGGYLLDNDGFRFMERYAPKLMELAPRDMVSRAIYQEIRPGRGIDGKDYVYLDVRHLGRKVIEEKLPDITDFARIYQGVEPHDRAGADPADRALRDGRHPDRPVRPGDARRGEHGRAGPVRRGRDRLRLRARRQPPRDELARRPARVRASRRPRDGRRRARRGRSPTSTTRRSWSRPGRSSRRSGHARAGSGARSARELADVMMDDVGVYRDAAGLRRATQQGRRAASDRYRNVHVQDKGTRLQHGPARGARARLPARLRRGDRRCGPRTQGEPRRPQPRGLPRARRRDFLSHSLATKRDGAIDLAYKPVTITQVPAQAARLLSGGRPTMQVDLRILRYDPERDTKPHEERYTVEAGPMDRVLDLLHKVKYEQDGTLTFRRSCAHGVCGSDAMLINGRNRLACKIRVDQLGRKITVAPLPGLPLMKDLVVDMEAFFAKFRSVQPYLQTNDMPPLRERPQSAEERSKFDDTTKCILCAACTSSCPSFWAQPSYVGPAAIVNAHRFIFDSRDDAEEERLEILADKDGVWRCRTIFNCTDACPRGIHITQAILEVSSKIVERRA